MTSIEKEAALGLLGLGCKNDISYHTGSQTRRKKLRKDSGVVGCQNFSLESDSITATKRKCNSSQENAPIRSSDLHTGKPLGPEYSGSDYPYVVPAKAPRLRRTNTNVAVKEEWHSDHDYDPPGYKDYVDDPEAFQSLREQYERLQKQLYEQKCAVSNLERRNKVLEELGEKSEKRLKELQEFKDSETSRLKKDVEGKNMYINQLEGKLKRRDALIQSYELRVRSAIHSLNQPFEEAHIPDLLDKMVMSKYKVKTEAVEIEALNQPVMAEKSVSIPDETEYSHSGSRHKITDRQNRRWSHEENVTILEYLLKTIRSGASIEKPNAPKYYTKMISECSLSSEITHNLLRNKVQNFRRAFEKSKKDHSECSYRNYLEEIWGTNKLHELVMETIETHVRV